MIHRSISHDRFWYRTGEVPLLWREFASSLLTTWSVDDVTLLDRCGMFMVLLSWGMTTICIYSNFSLCQPYFRSGFREWCRLVVSMSTSCWIRHDVSQSWWYNMINQRFWFSVIFVTSSWFALLLCGSTDGGVTKNFHDKWNNFFAQRCDCSNNLKNYETVIQIGLFKFYLKLSVWYQNLCSTIFTRGEPIRSSDFVCSKNDAKDFDTWNDLM